jgi:Flp pilus assembly protein TadG
VVLAFIFLVLVGLVLDGGAKLRAGREAAAIAEEAARAGAGQIDRNRAYTRGSFIIDRGAAVRAANNYLAAAGRTGTVTPVSATRIEVSVTVSKPTVMLSLIGIGSMTVTSTATADLLTGVNGPGR